MINYQIILEYLGSNYVGWQYQKNGASIQSLVEKALSKILKSKVIDLPKSYLRITSGIKFI